MITFYTTHCPKCKVLELKLKQKNIDYTECEDIEQMRAAGLASAPALLVDGKILLFADAVRWINER